MADVGPSYEAEVRRRARHVLQRFDPQGGDGHVGDVSRPDLAAMIDHTVLKPDATPAMIDRACAEALEHRFASVCVNACYVERCAERLAGSGVAVCSVVGFPLGATLTEVKVYEARRAISLGAREIDMVLWIGGLKAGDCAAVRDDIRAVSDACHEQGAICKVIIEAALLSDEEKVLACLLIVDAGADYCKTSTGFGPGGATEHDVRLMRAAAGSDIGVKAAGGIRDYAAACAMVRAGATRIGASAGPQILQGAPQ